MSQPTGSRMHSSGMYMSRSQPQHLPLVFPKVCCTSALYLATTHRLDQTICSELQSKTHAAISCHACADIGHLNPETHAAKYDSDRQPKVEKGGNSAAKLLANNTGASAAVSAHDSIQSSAKNQPALLQSTA